MIIIDKEQTGIETYENSEEQEAKVRIKKIYRILRKIAEFRIKGQIGES